MAPNTQSRRAEVAGGKGFDAAALAEAAELSDRSASRVISRKELASHASRESAWIGINGRVYDVTGFEHHHPGGEIILTAAGQDATDVFAAFHTASTYASMLPKFLIGSLEPETAATQAHDRFRSEEYVADIRKMRTELARLQAFDASLPFYAYKLATNVSILSLATFLALRAGTSLPVLVLAAVILALFWQQCGWLAHDFLHHQVFKNRVLNNIAGLLVGNVFQGFSVSWWKMKHNHHHAAPNVTETPAGGDPDIHTYPLLLWSEKLIEGSAEEIETLPRFLLTNQKVFYWPILCMARVSWVIQSVLFQAEPTWNFVGGNAWRAVEMCTLFVHHAAYAWLVMQLQGGFWHQLVFVAVSQALGGLFIGVVFTVGHNAMEVLKPDEMKDVDFVRMQIKTTRNIDPSAFNVWFSGGLSHQIEHHIWPTLPRHSLPKARELLMAFCEKYAIEYTSKGLVEGNVEVCKLLAAVGRAI
mmetsp:Transcript_11569/g.24987  ORF Transcript_11569/g.24987 Transcript_11569/m.24987 type:complete len:473 (+) Transcript_11569:167-1585(+)|eukprot:CAMPEP_0185857284 /NCGR_PEP_ID=MMETSP1354-20130828/29419_1 /TAXON_ID=708628 /ORGANISM="Erythrolobus madagascarensis, Strain CCMP3276" /LENGTH=472 /DNA_ID=CAMNT_0028559551 /DNA_START=215 /DNA_END=1633 /DNA_ORIENTATION=-